MNPRSTVRRTSAFQANALGHYATPPHKAILVAPFSAILSSLGYNQVMKLVIFAGGTGTRLWPLSRKNFPKQFIKMFNNKSTLQLAVDRVKKPFGLNNIIISTNEAYVSMTKSEVPEIPVSNIVGEPEKRDVAPAVGLNLMRLKKQGYKGPVALLWADHLITNIAGYLELLKTSEDFVRKNPTKMVFVGEKPRFADNNIGWIKIGGELTDKGFYAYKSWKYKPDFDACADMYKSGEWVWNSGYVVEDLDFALSLFETLQPELFSGLRRIYDALGTSKESQVVKEVYPKLPKVSHDNAISEKVTGDQAVVFLADIGFSDPGTLYVLKKALESDESANVEVGLTSLSDSHDTMVFNKEVGKLVAGIGLDGMVIVNTKDAVLVVPKNKVLGVSKFVEALAVDPKLKKFI
ncbi:MAG: Mannose-1-phosphate guanylyltransferase [candidate division WWE3 bacterium GW2011_GWB1_44_4]|uniref:Mannose-1-phosphate guanylyltransferase n=2 Tax=Katanobacteria TaxID=422282 RepID=A0A0G1JF89_UNCKA|nr:MAG: Mannose-1-phosphate guanylyltransferase [candidate division WWE3 bacterium GW2011_GWB1_44_4]